MFLLKKEQPMEVIEDNEDAIRLQTTNGVVNAKKVISVNGKHVMFVDQYGNVREAFLR
jgi:hypothetical protein